MTTAAGFPQYIIAHYGGWTEKSKSSLQRYTNVTSEMSAIVSKHMTGMADVSIASQFTDATRVRQSASGNENRK
jgi:hypothetical protein